MFAKRLASSILLWATLLGVLFYLNALASALLCCLISTIALLEFYDMLKAGGRKCAKWWGVAGGVLLSSGTWYFCARHPELTNTFEILFLVAIVLTLFFRQLFDKENPACIETMANTLFGIIYVVWLFNFFPKLKYHFAVGQEKALFPFYAVLVTKACDTGAYLVGRSFGRHKMMPRISPNKTWEGLLGGFVFAIIASLSVFNYLESRISSIGFTQVDAIALGVLLGFVSVVGDLGESLLKRETHVKDSGEMLPGIGGALDLIDSLLFTAPVLYAYLFFVVHRPV
jgi:phosphatidate cytidylyltransferase